MKEISKTQSGKKLSQNKYHKLKFKTPQKNYISINIYKTVFVNGAETKKPNSQMVVTSEDNRRDQDWV